MRKPVPQVRIVPQNQSVSGERLDSWKEIARYLNRDVRTVQRWEESGGLPVHRHNQGGQKSGPVYAFKSEIDAWLHRNPPSITEKELEPEPPAQMRSKTRGLLWILSSLFILFVTGAVVWRYLHGPAATVPLRVVNLTSYSGMEQFPAFSPDGTKIAFSWNGPNQDNYDIYVKFLDGGESLRLTTHPGEDGWPTWSPDGRFIAFGRWVLGAPIVELLTVPALGGAERKIFQIPVPLQSSSYWPADCWTPDGKWLVGPMASEALGLISPQTMEVRRLTDPAAAGASGDCCPAIAPDGRSLAFLRASSARIWNLYTQSLSAGYQPAGMPRQVTSEPAGVENPMWAGNGRELLYITSREGERILWRVPYDLSHPAARVELLGSVGYNLTLSPSGDRLAYQDNLEEDIDIWRVDLAGDKGVRRKFSSSAADINPQISPDGKRVAFISRREKGFRVWVSDSDGAHPMELAAIIGRRPGVARWSPDGKQIVFECRNEGNNDICAVPSGGGSVQRLTINPARDILPSWSLDGKWIYVTSNRSGSFQIWKVPSGGNETGAMQVTRGGGFAAQEWDGYVYFSREAMFSGVWRLPAGGGKEVQFGAFRNLGQSFCFAPGREGIYYTSSTDPDRWFELWLCRYSTGKSERIIRINKRLYNGLSVSPDDRWLLVAAAEVGSGDLHMVENFR